MKVVECEQGSAEWLRARVGKVTASRICEALSKYKGKGGKSGENAERWNYRVDMLVERMTGRSTENFTSPEMIWGMEHEAEAVQTYELKNCVLAESVGFIIHPRFDWSGASPDALVGNNGGVEIKCPKTATHFKWYWKFIKQGLVPEEHRDQVMWNMACAEREWWDFASYDPRVRPGTRLLPVRMYRDEKRIEEMEFEAEKFNEEVNAMLEELAPLIEPEPPPPLRESAPESMSAWAEQFESEFGETAI